jgi:PHD/YefM family antitoxin component YafN of YafNO toxin-antitoxin module
VRIRRSSVRSAKTFVARIAITKARINLGSVAKRAHLDGEYFILEKDGIPIAGIMSADELEDYLELRDPKVKKQITESRKDAAAGRLRDVGDFVVEMRAERAGKKGPRMTRKS